MGAFDDLIPGQAQGAQGQPPTGGGAFADLVPEDAGVGQTVLDQAVSFFGGANQTIAQILGMPVDAVNYLLRGIGIPGTRETPMAEGIQRGMEAVGITARPRTGTAGERAAGAAGGGAGGGAFFGPAGILPGMAGGLAAQGAEALGASPATQAVAGMAGGMGAGGVANVASKTARVAAGAPGTPMLEALRAEGVAPRMAGDVAGSRALQQTTAFMFNAPLTGTMVQSAARKTTEEIAMAVDRRAAAYGAGTVPAEAGAAIETGVKNYVERVGAVADKLYARLNKLVPPTLPVQPQETQTVVGELIATMPGLAKTSSGLTPGLFKNLADDITGQGTPTFAALSRLRTEVGRKLGDPMLADDISRGELKRLYGALTTDLRAAAQNVSPQALREFDRTNAFYKKQMDFIEGAFRKFNQAGVSPENMFQWAMSEGRIGATRLASLRKAMGDEQFGIVSSTVLRRLGTGGKDAPFDTNVFMREWEKLTPEAKQVLFGKKQWGEYAQSIDRLVSIADEFRETGRLANTSRTAGTNQLFQMLSAFAHGTVLGTTGAAAAAGTVAAQVGTQAMVSKLLTSPRFAIWLATPAGPNQVPRRIAALAGVAAQTPELAPEIGAFAAYIAEQTQGAGEGEAAPTIH